MFVSVLHLLTKIKVFYIYGKEFTKYLHGTWYFFSYPNDFWHKSKICHFDPYNVLLAIARNIPGLFVTGFVIQGHIFSHDKTNKKERNSAKVINVTWNHNKKNEE